MSIPYGAKLANGQDVQTLETEVQNSALAGLNHNGRPEKSFPHYDEYTTLLKKHLNVVESELSRLKGSKT